MSNWIEWCKKEIELAGLYDKDSDYRGMLGEALDEVIQVLDNQGHSGFSMGVMRRVLQRLMNWEPLGPLTGKEDEWNQIKKDLWQNKRCPRVFKNDKGEAWDRTGKVFVEPDGTTFTSRASRVYITFPYTPKTEYVKVKKND